MKNRIIAVVMLFVIMTALIGCGNTKLPFLSKPEDAIDDLMTEDRLIEILSIFESNIAEIDNEYTDYVLKVISSPTLKKLYLDNVRTLSYSITDVKTNNDNTATVTVLITHNDITPIIDRAVQLTYDKAMNLDESYDEIITGDLEGQLDLFFSLLQKSINEAATKIKPIETYTRVQFDCYRDTNMIWQVDEIPDDFGNKVLLMNYFDAWSNATSSVDYN